MSRAFLTCVAQALQTHAARNLERKQVLEEHAYCAVAREVLKGWQARVADPQQQRKDLEDLARATPELLHQMAKATTADAPEHLRKSLTAYLELIPEAIRRAFVHSADPTGCTMPPQGEIKMAGDLMPFLPSRAPHFQAGERPLPDKSWMLDRLLGIGGFGEVWQARNSRGQSIALKFYLDPKTPEKIATHEAAILEEIDRQGGHPGIVLLQKFHRDTNPPCLQYEYVDGIDLGRHIREWPEESPEVLVERTLELMIPLTGVVAAIHRMPSRFVHRDLKPTNILLERQEANGYRVRLTDFGISNVAEHLADGHARTIQSLKQRLVTGLERAYTAGHASPQQLKGEKADPSDDIHALGVIWYQMLMRDLHIAQIPRDWRALLAARGIPSLVLDLLKRCIASRVEGRLRNAEQLAEELQKLRPRPARWTTSQGIEMARVPAGTFWMSHDNTNAQRQVEIPYDFYMGVYPVTQEQWQAVMGNNPSCFSRQGNGKDRVRDIKDADLNRFPVENVSWDMAQEFLEKLNAQATRAENGWLYRLPTEAEWEYSCRGGRLFEKQGRMTLSKEHCSFDFYFEQPTNDLSSEQANFDGNYPAGKASKGPYLERPSPVGSYSPNALGLHDLHGNVWEWCDDRRASGASARVIRGGGWDWFGSHCSAADRSWDAPEDLDGNLGIRLARVPSGLKSQ